jgi:predicted Ser/Thr protein kinase
VPEPGDPATVGPYRVEGVLGEGGLGRVYLGRTPAGIAVAVKVMHREFAADNGFRQRLAQEVATVRQVQGLYTVPVVDADTRGERPWLASAYVAGPSLQHAVTTHGPGATEAVVRLVAGVAEALQSLHAAGVVHRDLTPSNVLLTANGPRLTDYGISRAADDTSVGRAGTPAYLAPEYIRGEEVTGAADVFALGSLAYFAATGRLAFGGGHVHAVTYRIVQQTPDLDGCPEPLPDIVKACVNKDPRQRPTPAEIIQWCQATLHAGPPSPPAPPTAPPPLAQPTWPVATQPGYPAPPVVPPQPGLTRRRLLLGGTALAVVAGLGVTTALVWPDDDDTDDTDADGGPRNTGPFRLVATLTGHTASVNSIAFSPDGRQLATMSGAEVLLWDVAGRSKRAVLADDVLHAAGLAFSPDGRLLATADDDQTVSLWDVAGRTPRVNLAGHTGAITDVAISPDGRLVATASEDETARLWDVVSGRQTAVLGGHNASVGGVDFHHGGRLLASCASWGVLLWDIPSGRRRDVLDGHENLWNVAFSPDGTLLAAADAGAGETGASVILWDTEDIGRRTATLGGHESPINDVAFSPDGRLLATAGREKTKVWDVTSGKQRAAFDTADPFTEVAFSATGMLATSQDAEVTLWEAV